MTKLLYYIASLAWTMHCLCSFWINGKDYQPLLNRKNSN